MEREHSLGLMVQVILVNGNLANNMGLALSKPAKDKRKNKYGLMAKDKPDFN